jgi:hypothetical protein
MQHTMNPPLRHFGNAGDPPLPDRDGNEPAMIGGGMRQVRFEGKLLTVHFRNHDATS